MDTYPPNQQWRLAARFDAFPSPKPIRIPDVRGGFMDLMAAGEQVFEGSEQFFVMFKDPTNLTTTYTGYRILFPMAVEDNEWTVLDFNLAANPPCAYSRYTTCPMPPQENALKVAVEAGEKRYRLAQL